MACGRDCEIPREHERGGGSTTVMREMQWRDAPPLLTNLVKNVPDNHITFLSIAP